MGRIYIADDEAKRLRDIIEQHSEGRDSATVRLLAEELDRATVVQRVPENVVTIGSRVRFEDERNETARDVVVVYPQDANASAGRISVLAPIGAALLGLTVGDKIEWPLPAGRTALIRIRSVDPPHQPAAMAA